MKDYRRLIAVIGIAVLLVATVALVVSAKQKKAAAPEAAVAASCPMTSGGMSMADHRGMSDHKNMVGCGNAAGQCWLMPQQGGTAGSETCPMHSQATAASPAKPTSAAPSASSTQAGSSITLKLSGLLCDACADNVARSLRAVPGVTSATVTTSPMRAVVTYDPAKTSIDALKKAVRQAEPVHSGQRFDVVDVVD